MKFSDETSKSLFLAAKKSTIINDRIKMLHIDMPEAFSANNITVGIDIFFFGNLKNPQVRLYFYDYFTKEIL